MVIQTLHIFAGFDDVTIICKQIDSEEVSERNVIFVDNFCYIAMNQEKKSAYKYCLVPRCKNTTSKAPNKLFFLVPQGKIRAKWCKIMRRDQVSPTTPLYCCEDHFDVSILNILMPK